MGSLPFVLRVVLPRSGAVPPNSAIVLDGHVVGQLSVTARVAGADLSVALEPAPELGARAPGTFRTWLVRPTNGDWPAGSVVVLTATRDPQEPAVLDVPIASERDVTPPVFSSMSPPERKIVSGPREPSREVVLLSHRGFTDEASPLVIVTLEAGGSVLTGSVLEGMAGGLPMPPGAAQTLDAITLADLAGNAMRIANPCTAAPEPAPSRDALTCVAGTLATEGDWLVGSTDAGTENGFSRGHYRAPGTTTGDIEISVTAARLTDDHAMPIEIAFRGGFFGVTGTSLFYIYESDTHWTGWKSTPGAVGTGPVSLRVVQRGAEVHGYVNGALAGSLVLDEPISEGPVGVFFKGPPGQQARIRFRDFAVKPPAPESAPRGAPLAAEVALVWGGHDEGVGEPHPSEATDPSGKPWDFVVLAREDDNTVLARVWVGSIHTRVVADFSFDDALRGTEDEAVLPLLVEGFFGDDGHTLGYYRSVDRFTDVRFTNLRTGSFWPLSWESMDEMVEQMKLSPSFVRRDMR